MIVGGWILTILGVSALVLAVWAAVDGIYTIWFMPGCDGVSTMFIGAMVAAGIYILGGIGAGFLAAGDWLRGKARE